MFGMGKIALVSALVSAAAMVTVGAGTAAAERGPDGHYYGAIAISTGHEDGTIWATTANYPNQADADRDALDTCGYTNCYIVTRYMDGCGALARRDGRYLGASAATRAEAERLAFAAFGPARPATMSSAGGEQAVVVGSECNG